MESYLSQKNRDLNALLGKRGDKKLKPVLYINLSVLLLFKND